jgi:hypothetical protein
VTAGRSWTLNVPWASQAATWGRGGTNQVSVPGGNLEVLGWLVVIAGLAAFVLAAVTVIVLAARAVRRRIRAARDQRSIRAIRHISDAAGEGLIRPDELQRYGDILRARVEYPDDGNGHEDKGAA